MKVKAKHSLIVCGLLLFCACLLSMSVGASSVNAMELLSALTGNGLSEKAYRIIVYVRLPRLLAALLAGSSLAVAGVLLQEVLMNPLASPGVIGVNAGAGLFALFAMTFFPGMLPFVPIASFLGAMIAAMGVYLLARFTGASKSSIILAGIAVSSLLGACMDAIVTLIPDAVSSRSAFSIGGFAGVSMQNLLFALPLCIVGVACALLCRRELSVMSMGEEVARGLGLNVKKYRLLFLAAAAMLAGGAVSFSGLIGFVGLITPHVARVLTKGDEGKLIPMSMLMGALLCVVCDLIARTLFAPYELPVGIVLSFIGAPFFVYLLIRRKRSNRHDSV